MNSFVVPMRRFCTKPVTNGEISPFVYNRNPRNLERLRLARKPLGFPFEKDLIEYWHKLCLKKSSRYVTAELIHNTGKVVVTASTKEWAIQKFLPSITDIQAHIILARVFAQRCMESGIISMTSNVQYEEGSKSELFLKELLREGISLTEPDYFDIHKKWQKKREKRPWTVL